MGRGESTSVRVVVRFYKCKVPGYQELNKEAVVALTVEEPESGGRAEIGSEKGQVLNLSPSRNEPTSTFHRVSCWRTC